MLLTGGPLKYIQNLIHRAIWWIEILSIVLLVILSVIAFFTFGHVASTILTSPQRFTPEGLAGLLDIVLLVFIMIELLNIALAFLEGRRVILTVFEAVLVAVARKIIASGTGVMEFDKAGALAVITIAIGLTWWLVTRDEVVVTQGRGDK